MHTFVCLFYVLTAANTSVIDPTASRCCHLLPPSHNPTNTAFYLTSSAEQLRQGPALGFFYVHRESSHRQHQLWRSPTLKILSIHSRSEHKMHMHFYANEFVAQTTCEHIFHCKLANQNRNDRVSRRECTAQHTHTGCLINLFNKRLVCVSLGGRCSRGAAQ